MAPTCSPALGPTENHPLSPFDPRAFAVLLREHPERGAAVLAAMRPAQLQAQLRANAALSNASVEQLRQSWRALIALTLPPPPPHDDDFVCAAVFEPYTLEVLCAESPACLHMLIEELSPGQRIQQAIAHAAWLERHGYCAQPAEFLARWDCTVDGELR